ncbi:hypothetical protein KAFR_0J00410 [Kazachstania africana CBS 2517]|uniref:NADPH--cytochrome P450 reductase n=1 Tax=Kazachstania africana (strain ATCC 22294 / BCRC 22015 / CBS 2517 / CECT 1963 / NBRC 1671 / NRRL Y-8276) TaxID=1071382 RepID=H2B0F9_KAZAF|nr:hypothetical protein KAFR_0J00410 [Kazachstania africana CBS 2517]CCF60109.1 hypothetical protein KAFR_0J00410 [Kazachstania africana CBS 2517]
MDSVDVIVLLLAAVAVLFYTNRTKLTSIFFGNDDSITVNSSSGDIVTVLKENKKNYLVLYASQTGTAEDYAKSFAKELISKFSLNVMCTDVENYEYDNLDTVSVPVSIFISTYGEGDFPDNAANFESFLNNIESSDLTNLKFTLFGFGNSTYEFYNGAAKRTLKALKSAGATLIGSYGEADDGSASTDEDYLSWKSKIFDDLKTSLNLDEQEDIFKPSFKYEVIDEKVNGKVALGEPCQEYLPRNKLPFSKEKNVFTGPFNANFPYVAPITASRELFQSDDRNCIHAEFDVSGSNLKYSTGDHLAIWPSNANETVEKFLAVFSLNPDEIFNLTPLDATIKLPFPCPTTIGSVVRHYMEITGPVSRKFFSSLVQFAPNNEIKERLEELSNDKDQFAVEITSKYYNIADAVSYLSNEKPWTTIPWTFLIESLARIQPRYYSISSSSLSEKQTIHVTAVVENIPNNKSGNPIIGVTTNLLRNIQLNQSLNEKISGPSLPCTYDLSGPRNLFEDSKLPVHVRRSHFKLPSNPRTPVIMIGPGTGVAPFRGFIRERCKMLELQSNLKLGKHLLFYGCRNNDDYLYKDEFPEYIEKMDGLLELFVAFSRLPGSEKVYAQDMLKENEEQVLSLMKQGAFIYVCGDAKSMAQAVHATLIDILRRGLQISAAEATEMLKMFKTTGKYQEDVW